MRKRVGGQRPAGGSTLGYKIAFRDATPADRAEAHDVTRWRQWLIARREAGLFDGSLGFLAGMVGTLPDPINFFPVTGQAFRAAWLARSATRGQRIAREAAVQAGEAAAQTAVLQPLIGRSRAYIGDDRSFADALLDILLGTAAGGAVGAVRGTLQTRGGRFRPAEPPASDTPTVETAPPAAPAGEPARVPPETDDTVAATPAPKPARWGEVTEQALNVSQAVLDVAQGRPVELHGPEPKARPAEPDPAGPLPEGFERADPADPTTVSRWVARALATRGNAMRLVLGPASPGNVAAVQDRTGVDIAGYQRILEQSRVRHVDRDHGPRSRQARSGGIPVRPEDYDALPQILDQPERVLRSPDAKGRFDRLVYERQMPDGYWYYVEEVRTGRRTLALIAFWKRPNRDPGFGRIGSRSGPPDLPGAPDGTSRQTSETPAVPARSREKNGAADPAAQVSGDLGSDGSAPEDSLSGVRGLAADELAFERPYDPSPGAPLRDHDAEVRAELAEPEEAALDPTTGAFPEQVLYDAALARGLINPADRHAVELAAAEAERLAELERAYEQAVACVLAGGLGAAP